MLFFIYLFADCRLFPCDCLLSACCFRVYLVSLVAFMVQLFLLVAFVVPILVVVLFVCQVLAALLYWLLMHSFCDLCSLVVGLVSLVIGLLFVCCLLVCGSLVLARLLFHA